MSTNLLKFWKHFEILSPDGSSRPAPDPETGSCDVSLIFLFPKCLERTGVWLLSLAQEAVPSATDESLEEVTVFYFKSFVMPEMCNLYFVLFTGG